MKHIIITIRSYSKYLLVIWVLTILSISSIPDLPSPKIETGGYTIRIDYIFHFCEYGILAFLALLTFVKEDFRAGLKKYLIITVSLILFALADEFHQMIIPRRTFNVKDILSNIAGILAALVYCTIMFRKIEKNMI